MNPLQEAASRRTKANAAAAAASAESNFTKIVNKVERIRLQDETTDVDVNEDDRNGNSSSTNVGEKKKKGGLDLKLEDAENENNLSGYGSRVHVLNSYSYLPVVVPTNTQLSLTNSKILNLAMKSTL